MVKSKYKFNTTTLLYEKVRYSFRQRIYKSLPFFGFTIVLSFIFLYYGGDILESPKLKRMNEEQSRILLNMNLMKNEVGKWDKILGEIEYNDDHIYRTYFEVDPVSSSIRNAGSGGNAYSSLYNNSRYVNLISNITSDLERLAKKLVIQSKSFDEVIIMAENKEKRLAARPSIQPVSIKDLRRFGSSFGMRIHPILKIPKMHEGIDLTCPTGTKVFASADGIVTESGYASGGYGNKIVIDHGYGYKTIYGHFSKLLVTRGQKVQRGEVIGLVGNTGLSKGSHLHYEVCVNGKKVNPFNFYASDLSPEEYDKMINLYSTSDPSFDIN